MKKIELIQKLKQLEGISQDEKAYLINLINTKKKYGLVWEDKPEDVEEQLRDNLPVLKEIKDKAILNGEDFPNHILIEGDNLHGLTALTFTHEGKIDVIYIDPPYNTGNKDFKYNDNFIDKEDSYRHSKWLSFMSKRLQIAKRLLNDNGVIFISIDDNEVNQLKLLCDEIFEQNNFLGLLPTVMNLKGNQDQFCFAGTHEYTLAYSKLKTSFVPNQFDFEDEELEAWDEDSLGLFKKGAPLRATGTEANREDRPLMFYPILVDKNNNVTTISKDEHGFIYNSSTRIFDDIYLNEIIEKYKKKGYEVVLPYVDLNQFGRWRWGYNDTTIDRLGYDVIIIRTKNGISLYKKQRPELGELPSKKPKTIFYRPEYSSGNGTAQLKDIMHGKVFNNPKPVDLIKDIITIATSKKAATILDFTAGSGTTLHAILELNRLNGSKHLGILITNNDNKICEEITYERSKRRILGYKNAKGQNVGGISENNLRYYKSDLVRREPSVKNKKEVTQLATELLCIKENIYREEKTIGDYRLSSTYVKCFKQDNLYLIIIYDEEVIDQIVAVIQSIIEKAKGQKPYFKVYVFSNGQYPYTEEFEEVLEFVTLCALPDAIYKAYQNVLPKRHRKSIPEMEEQTTEGGQLALKD